jgi:hypothetical protein
MSSTNIRPRWWQLYLTFPLLIALFAVDNRLKLSSRGHQIVQIGIILVLYGLIHLWLKANARALSRMDQQAYSSTFKVIEIPAVRDPEANHARRSILQLSDSEIKGLLTDSSDMSYLNVDSTSMQELRKN